MAMVAGETSGDLLAGLMLASSVSAQGYPDRPIRLIVGFAAGGSADLAARAGYSPTHFQRVFTRATGLSPAAYARALREERAREALSAEGAVSRLRFHRRIRAAPTWPQAQRACVVDAMRS